MIYVMSGLIFQDDGMTKTGGKSTSAGGSPAQRLRPTGPQFLAARVLTSTGLPTEVYHVMRRSPAIRCSKA